MVAKAEGINASESHVHGIIESVFDPEMSGHKNLYAAGPYSETEHGN